MSFATVVSIISATLGLLKWYVTFSEQQKWIKAGESQALLKGLQDADRVIGEANQARQAARDLATRDPDSVMRDDPFKRPD